MAIVYVPRLIESAEQAEALPLGTVVRHDSHMPLEKWRDEYGATYWGYLEEAVEADTLVGWTALVPIEAEEEYTTERAGGAWDNDAIYSSPDDVRRDGYTDPLQTRYITPWKYA